MTNREQLAFAMDFYDYTDEDDISEMPYCKLFDVLNNELKGGAEE